MKKINILPIIVLPFLLTSCLDNGYAGKYVFQLGKLNQTHVGMYLDLYNEVYSHKVKEGYKSFHISGSFGTNEDIMLEDDFVNLLSEGISGYYFVEKSGNRDRIFFGTNELDEYLGVDIDLDVDQDIVENIAVGYISKKEVDIVIPVSFVDLQMQLIWYGHFIYVNLDNEFKPPFYYQKLDNLPGSKNQDERIGTHPTKEQVELVNQRYKSLFDEYGVTYRDHHTLSITLVKK